jgi:type II secretory pathway pseudopilin PulG
MVRARHQKIALAIVAIVVLAFLVRFAVHQVQYARLVARESAQRALFVETTHLLQDYYATHGRYPETLRGLAFTYPDGSDSALLDCFVYEPRVDGYHLRSVGVSSGETFESMK